MIDTNDQMISDLQPLMKREDWIEDMRKIVGDSNYHSDEISESDDEKGNAFLLYIVNNILLV